MNISNSVGLTPSSFRRVLTEHGRTSTPGLLEFQMEAKPKNLNQVTAVKNELPVTDKAPEVKASITKTQQADSAKMPQDLHSFYARPFRVHGNEAWEYAMRDLGSIDTLMNRYGYVEPGLRHDSPAARLG
ncbi:hypothetical protein PoB_004921400 [Plakobranchus ocellatus]|uniref:Uncharacterized protein n=1 Tax=Plakobranchus ocellatus TaxID=259542 RepID=A0AAV4BWB5_9GAST|nr:hypothetical protein PoB_004921400 [Plakobranchus ocellatus]